MEEKKRVEAITGQMRPRPPPVMRQFGQTSLSSSFFSRSRASDGDRAIKPINKNVVSLSEFLDRKIVKTNSKSLAEKQASFSLVGSPNNDSSGKKDGACSNFVLGDAIFRQFKVSAKEKQEVEIAGGGDMGESQTDSSTGDGGGSRKRNCPFDDPSGVGERLTARKTLVVLGDDPKPCTYRKEKKAMNRTKPFYDHYATGSGKWDCSREGVDNEEVGCTEFWEGLGSTTLGGLEWH